MRALGVTTPITTILEGIRYGSQNLGHAMLVLGGMHAFNLFILSRMRRRGLATAFPPSGIPDGGRE